MEDPSSESGSGASPGAPPPSATDTGGDESGGAEASDTEGERSQRDWEAMQEGQAEERDLEMDLYASRVRRFIRSYYIRRAAGCFERESRNDRNVRGTVVVGFVIPASGIVEDARVVRNSTGSETLAACLARQVGSWRLPAPPDGAAPLEMQMPFSR